jgi:hypothetical protein
MNNEITVLAVLLSQVQLLDSPFQQSGQGKDLYQQICEIVFEDRLYLRIPLSQNRKESRRTKSSGLVQACQRRKRMVSPRSRYLGNCVAGKELPNIPGPANVGAALAECQTFWKRTVGAQHDLPESSQKQMGEKDAESKIKNGPSERPYCFLFSDNNTSY